MATQTFKNAAGADFTAELPLAPGRAAAASSRPVVLSTEDMAVLGAATETAPTTDTASSGLNGRLQRVAQRLTSLVALFPTSLGSKADTASLAVTRSTEDKAAVGALTESAPGTDTASSGLNGRLQRIAQRLTSLIALFPTNFATVGVKAGATAAQDSDSSLVVQLHPRSSNANGTNSRENSSPVTVAYDAYEAVAASQTDQIMGATGAVGDILSHVLIIPATLSPGGVSIKDGNGSSIPIFDGGTVGSLIPFAVPLNVRAAAATTPGWKLSTGANVRAIGVGKFT